MGLQSCLWEPIMLKWFDLNENSLYYVAYIIWPIWVIWYESGHMTHIITSIQYEHYIDHDIFHINLTCICHICYCISYMHHIICTIFIYSHKVHGMSTSSSSDIVLPMIQSHNGKSYTAGVVRKKSTPKIISTRRHFELYGRGDQRLGSKIFFFHTIWAIYDGSNGFDHAVAHTVWGKLYV